MTLYVSVSSGVDKELLDGPDLCSVGTYEELWLAYCPSLGLVLVPEFKDGVLIRVAQFEQLEEEVGRLMNVWIQMPPTDRLGLRTISFGTEGASTEYFLSATDYMTQCGNLIYNAIRVAREFELPVYFGC